MYNESGFGTGGTPYEYVVTPKADRKLKMKKILFLLLYFAYGGGLLIVGSTVGKLFLPLLAFIPVTVWILVFFTWRYTQVAYEYSFWGGELTVNRMLGERSKKKMLNVKIRDLEQIEWYRGEHRETIDAIAVEKKIFAVSSPEADRLVSVVWTDENGQKAMLIFEADEKAVKILKYYNSKSASLV